MSSLFLYCNATGFPKPRITWTFTNKTNNNIIRSNQSVLHITAATRHDHGIYVCQATNGIGESASADVNVSVQCKFLMDLGFTPKEGSHI